ncbi:hypothetical protein [Salinigranum halophilum]|uniref:hypothetical protein n=1 Tax=Salinigranum halophilum TaxID=2565931 RepID=UPI0010A8835D|nr:hypothetical protein [Salinigranum halophilum]
MAAALVVGLVTATAFTGVISASGQTLPSYERDTADISFISFCSTDGEIPDGSISVTFEQVSQYEKDWQVSFTTVGSPDIDYVILKGGNRKNDNGYFIRIDDPSSPVSIFDENISPLPSEYNGPQDLPDETCLPGDSGVKFER